MPHASTETRLAITVDGIVQGVGFRPFIHNAACDQQLAGWVRNQTDAVHIEVQGPREALDRFLERLRSDHPPQARIDAVRVREIPARQPHSGTSPRFQIRASSSHCPPSPAIPPDLATCPECLAEIGDRHQRRFRYPFTNCTNCGPRWSIIERLPYDRPRTSMHGFRMCMQCRREYDDPSDRRFHAQPIACPQCGPELQLSAADGTAMARGEQALTGAARAVQDGKVLALKGLGGFQLLVDATRDDAVRRLRQRKRRPDKPLAVMLADSNAAAQRCEVSREEMALLVSHRAPIVLLRRRSDQDALRDLSARVAPGNPELGVMLPYTPLHHLLVTEIGKPMVCTSGNLSEEPMAVTFEDALQRLGRIADLFLTHNRPIVRPVDDSVVRAGPSGPRIMRRARGYAPLPIRLPMSGPTILGTGGHLKNAVALSMGNQVIVSPHIGDLDSALAMQVHRQTIRDLVEFFHAVPEAVACDLHPDYGSTRHAEQLAEHWNVPLLRIQHHHAHIASCVAESGIEGPVLGLSWDGTGLGTDNTVWGGEILLCDGAEFTRVAHLRTFPLPGGDKAARQPRRSALGMLLEILGPAAAELAASWFDSSELRVLISAAKREHLFPRTSSMGRLFDAVAALCGLHPRVSFEGQAAVALQFAADPNVRPAYPFPLSDGDPTVIDWEPMIRQVIADRACGVPVAQVAARLHNGLADMALAVVRSAGTARVVLSGGCFQNSLLVQRIRERLGKTGQIVYTQSQVPPGDGGIALGQVLIAARQLEKSSHVSRHPR